MKVGAGSDLYRAVKTVMERVPALKGDARPESLQQMAKRLASQGVAQASLVANADAATLSQVRLDVLKDHFGGEQVKGGAALTGDTQVPKGERPLALISGGSYTGMTAALVAVRAGQDVVLVEPRPGHVRDIRLADRQGMLDTLALLDPKLVDTFLAKVSAFDPDAVRLLSTTANNPKFKTVQKHEARAPDPSKAPKTGKELMSTPYVSVAIAHEFETLVEKYVKENFGGRIQFVNDGKLDAAMQPDGNVKWQLEKPPAQKGGPPVYEDLLKGRKPSMVVIAEGSGSPTRTKMDIKYEATTPQQHWIAGVIGGTDPQTEKSTLRVLYDARLGEPQRAVAISDGSLRSHGKPSTWVLTQMAPGFAPDPKQPQQEINDYYFQRAALVTGRDEADLRQAGAAGPFNIPGSVPTAFTLQGKAANEAARVLPDGTVVAFMGDAVQTSTFQAGGGMNTAISEALTLMTLMGDLQSGADPKEAAAKYQEEIFERGNAWSLTGIPYFYARTTEEKTQAIIDAQLKAITDWRREGGPSPLERMNKILAELGLGTEPVGMKLAA